MKVNHPISWHDLGMLLHTPCIMALVSVVVALACRDWIACLAFAAVTLISLSVGRLLCSQFKRSQIVKPYRAMYTVSLAWLITGLLVAVPFWIVGIFSPADSQNAISYASPTSAIFEGFSGITSCGLTMSSNPNLLSPSLQWWRALLEWIGGVGVVVLALALTNHDRDPEELFEAEARSSSKASVRSVSLRIWQLYLGYTIATVAALWAAGLTPWEALNHGLTAISTGGFSITPDGFRSYRPVTLLVTITAMILGATSFSLHSEIWIKRHWRAWLHNTQFRCLIFGILGGSIILYLASRWSGDHTDHLKVLFQWVSALCTCGFSAVNMSSWSAGPLVLIIVAMMIGGAAGSTAGGVKLGRIAWILKGMWRYVIHSMHENKSKSAFLKDGHRVSFKEGSKLIRSAALMLAIWLSVLTAGALVLLLILPDARPLHVIFEVASATGGVGLSTGIASVSLPSSAKLLLAALMWIGRLEIIAVMSIIVRPFLRLLRG